MLDFLGWKAAGDAVRDGLANAVAKKRVTYDLARQMAGATEVKCSEFAAEIVRHLH
jgi:isocitrate dehydrogenase